MCQSQICVFTLGSCTSSHVLLSSCRALFWPTLSSRSVLTSSTSWSTSPYLLCSYGPSCSDFEADGACEATMTLPAPEMWPSGTSSTLTRDRPHRVRGQVLPLTRRTTDEDTPVVLVRPRRLAAPCELLSSEHTRPAKNLARVCWYAWMLKGPCVAQLWMVQRTKSDFACGSRVYAWSLSRCCNAIAT